MYKHNIAILVDNFHNTEQSNDILNKILSNKEYDCTIFTISKENVMPNPLAIFSMADYFNWSGVTIITSPKTLEKSIAYPAIGPKIILGKYKYEDYSNLDEFSLNLIDGIINEHSQNEC